MRPTLATAAVLAVVLSSSAPSRADQILSFVPGFNFKGVLVRTEATSRTLFTAQPAVEQVFAFDATAQAFRYQLRLTGGTLFGGDLELPPLAGIVVRSSSAAPLAEASLPRSGDPATNDPLPSLLPGFNFVALPAPPAGVTTARGLLAARPELESLFRWDTTAQSFAFVLKLPDGTLFGSDFPLAPADAAYFLKMRPRVFTALELTPATMSLPVGGQFDLAGPDGVLVRARYADGGGDPVSDGVAWSLASGAGELAGTLYRASATVGDAATLRATLTRFGETRSADLAVTMRAPLLLGISLAETERTVPSGAEMILQDEFPVTGSFEGGAREEVSVSWRLVSGGGEFPSPLYIAPVGPATVVFEASRQEGAITYTVELTLQVVAQ